jgi:competence protein ComGF
VLTKDFVERYLNTFPSVNKEIISYFKNNIVKAEWINNAILDERVINNILRIDEDIECTIDKSVLTIKIKFSSGDEEFKINMKEA